MKFENLRGVPSSEFSNFQFSRSELKALWPSVTAPFGPLTLSALAGRLGSGRAVLGVAIRHPLLAYAKHSEGPFVFLCGSQCFMMKFVIRYLQQQASNISLLQLFEVSGPSGPYWLIAFAESMEAGFRLPCRLQPPVCDPGASIASAERRFRVLQAV